MPRPLRRRGAWYVAAAVLVAALALAAAASSLKTAPHTWSVGDGAVLEIYTLHASHGTLEVGPYSRFGWNHPGPLYFYALAPAYALSGHREEALLLTVLVFNLAAIAAMLSIAARYGGWALAGALMAWIALYYLRPGVHAGWDFGDLLSSAWNPHAPLLPFALLIVLAAVLAAGHLGALPFIVLVGSFISQSHVAFLPMSMLVGGAALLAWAWPYVSVRPDMVRSGPVSNLVRAIDAVGALYLVLMIRVVLAGGFDVRIGSVAVSVNSIDKLLLYAAVIVGIRHLLSRNHPLVHRLLVRRRAAAPREDGRDDTSQVPARERPRWPAHTKRLAMAAVVVAASAWMVPLAGELTGPRPGNLVRLARSIGGEQVPDVAAGAAAFAHHVSGVVRPDFEVAAGGRLLGRADASWPVAVFVVVQLAALIAVRRSASTRGRGFAAALALICLVASAGGLWASIRVGAELHDHITFWVTMIGLVNLAALTAELVTRGAGMLPARRGTAIVVIAAFTAIVGASGAWHIAQGHHRDRFADERAAVHALSDALRASFNASPSGGGVRVDMGQDAWPIAAGLVLELYKRGIDVTVADDWVPVFGPPMASNGRETTEIVVADAERNSRLQADARYRLVGSANGISVYRRPL